MLKFTTNFLKGIMLVYGFSQLMSSFDRPCKHMVRLDPSYKCTSLFGIFCKWRNCNSLSKARLHSTNEIKYCSWKSRSIFLHYKLVSQICLVLISLSNIFRRKSKLHKHVLVLHLSVKLDWGGGCKGTTSTKGNCPVLPNSLNYPRKNTALEASQVKTIC